MILIATINFADALKGKMSKFTWLFYKFGPFGILDDFQMCLFQSIFEKKLKRIMCDIALNDEWIVQFIIEWLLKKV